MHFKSTLSPGRRRLVELMQIINFGRIDNLRVLHGQPILDPMPTIVREHKFGGDNGARQERDKEDFLIKRQVRELMEQLDGIGNGTIDQLEVKHGLPFRMIVTCSPFRSGKRSIL